MSVLLSIFLACRMSVLGLVVAATACLTVILLAPGAFAQGGPPQGEGPDFWQPGWINRGMWGPRSMNPDMRARMLRHWTYMHVGIPADYQGARSPYKTQPTAIDAGRALYEKHCQSCHGARGTGDRKASDSLSPSPALLAFMINRPMVVDEYLLWTISEGGKEFKTAMPAFKGTIARDDIWRIISYMRAGFPKMKTSK